MENHQFSGNGWSVEFRADSIQVVSGASSYEHGRHEKAKLSLQRKFLGLFLLRGNETLVKLKSCKKATALELVARLKYWELLPALDEAILWKDDAEALLAIRFAQKRWVSSEDISDLEARRLKIDIGSQFRESGCKNLLTEAQIEAATFVATGLEEQTRVVNDELMSSELEAQREFFDSIEKTPLSEEQARAVICFDNRVQVLAAAGSGKTSVMVARAAYAIHRGFVSPDEVLLLAFNRDAADELQERIETRFAKAGIPSEGIKASTFHAFGLEVIGRATGKKPRLARQLEQGDDLALVMEIVDNLRDSSSDFRYHWDLYRLLFANTSTNLDDDSPDGYDRERQKSGYRTFSGALVKSQGERFIADYLFFNGVDFEYERPFSHEVADETHSQYQPDFYYPGVDVWHEHWALDREGNPPKDFVNYAQDMEWKRSTHARFGTKLLETTWADVMFDDGLKRLQDELTDLGIAFDWNPDRPIVDSWSKPLKHEVLARLIRTFMSHVKSNTWSAADLERRLSGELRSHAGYRTRLFLSLYWPIHEEWERRLRAGDSVDFEDMLVQAADCLEGGTVTLPLKLIMVDEFQDSSQARARFVRGLVRAPDRYLLAVGDDWQSINRFAGADVSVMTQFQKWFGRGHQLSLTTTFRCSQEICDVARRFVSKNPAQFSKPMNSATSLSGRPVSVIFAEDEGLATTDLLQRISDDVRADALQSQRSRVVNVDVLGRYRFLRELVPRRKFEGLNVTFRTVHGSKGLEADYVIIPGMSTGAFGFPSNVTDDPVLDLAMPTPDTYPHAEERRLFYVALTRARHGVFIVASPTQPSPFVAELLLDQTVVTESPDGVKVLVCPSCTRGTLVQRHGPYDPFLGCSRFPACDYTSKVLCPDCGDGTLVQRKSSYGFFIGCSNYPACTHTAKIPKWRSS